MLGISSAYGGAAVAIVQDGKPRAEGRLAAEHGLAGALPALVADLLAGEEIDLVAAVVGPGSFTGLRSGLSVAHGVGMGRSVPVVGVTVAEAFAYAVSSDGRGIMGRELWTAIHARRGRVFIDRADGLRGYDILALPAAANRIAVCGNAADLVAGALAACGADVMLTAFRMVRPVDVAGVAVARLAAGLPAAPALPLYVDLAEARLPQAGVRPPPLGLAS